MDGQQRQDLVAALRRFAANQPDPDQPLLGFLGSGLLSANQIVEAVEKNTDDGQEICGMLEHGANKEGWPKVLARLSGRRETLTTEKEKNMNDGSKTQVLSLADDSGPLVVQRGGLRMRVEFNSSGTADVYTNIPVTMHPGANDSAAPAAPRRRSAIWTVAGSMSANRRRMAKTCTRRSRTSRNI